MRAPSLLLLSFVANLGVAAMFGAPLWLSKRAPPVAEVKPTGIVMKAGQHTTLEPERVEADVRREPAPVSPPPEEEAPPKAAPAPPAKKRAALPPAPPATREEAPPFAALVSARVDELPMCRRGGPEGPGIAEVVFLPEGAARVKLSEPYAGTETGACIARRLGRDARRYDGAPVAMRVRFSL